MGFVGVVVGVLLLLLIEIVMDLRVFDIRSNLERGLVEIVACGEGAVLDFAMLLMSRALTRSQTDWEFLLWSALSWCCCAFCGVGLRTTWWWPTLNGVLAKDRCVCDRLSVCEGKWLIRFVCCAWGCGSWEESEADELLDSTSELLLLPVELLKNS